MDRTVSHYEIGDQLGAGGMGVVHRAIDTKLGRPVALKFLSEGLASDETIRERFMQEARAASSLDHPNICTIFEIDETEDGRLFIAMAYYPGEPLDKILRRGPIEVDRAVSIAIQVARGLAAAHEALIVHRDVKPGNIMVTDRETVKILDFGLAKLASPKGLTRPDSTLGTPAYMSPEQLRGEKIDHQADIWSLGVVLFEMVTGRLPFKGDRAESMAHSILNDAPSRITTLRSGLPPKLEHVISKALAKSARARHESMAGLIADLQTLDSSPDSDAVTLQRESVRKKTSVAVLPFVDMSPDRDQEYFCEGIAEELLGALNQISDLRVASRTSSFQFKGSAGDIREIGEKLNVSTILEGSVRKAGHRVRVSAQLVNVEDGYRLWSHRFDRDMEDIFGIQDEIAQSIASALEVTLTAGETGEYRGSTKDVEAYDLYLKGRQFVHQQRRKAFEIAKQLFSQAIEIDPGYARAWAGIADCSSYLSLYWGAGEEAVADAEAASLKALQLDPSLAEVRAARGLALSLTKEYELAESELRHAVELNPSLFEAHYVFGRICLSQGKLRDAASHFKRACEISPDAVDAPRYLAMCWEGLGERVKARNADLLCIEAARKRLRQHPDDSRSWTMAAPALVELGEPEKAAEWIGRALAIDPDEPLIQYNAACAYIGLEKFEEAIGCLESAIGKGFLSRDWMDHDSDLDPLRDDPRFKELMTRLG